MPNWYRILERKWKEAQWSVQDDLNKQLFGEESDMAEEEMAAQAIEEEVPEAMAPVSERGGEFNPVHKQRYRVLSPEEVEEKRKQRLAEGIKKLHIAQRIIALIRDEGWALEELQQVECIIARAIGL